MRFIHKSYKKYYLIIGTLLFIGGCGSLGGILSGELDTDTIISGLKEALNVGIKNTVSSTSQEGGYLNNELIRIVLPKELDDVAKVLSKIGFKSKVDEFYTGMNRAAEKASTEATPIFIDAIKGMTITDAKKILDGQDDAATRYFETKTRGPIGEKFKPVIKDSMDKVGVAKLYGDIMDKYNAIPFTSKPNLDLNDYITNKALDGLFTVLAQEEKKIRQNPAARVTELLQKVFSQAGKKQ